MKSDGCHLLLGYIYIVLLVKNFLNFQVTGCGFNILSKFRGFFRISIVCRVFRLWTHGYVLPPFTD
jgi:hypothetical protein